MLIIMGGDDMGMGRKQIMRALDDNVTRLECELRDAERNEAPTRTIDRLRIRLGEARRIRNRICNIPVS